MIGQNQRVKMVLGQHIKKNCERGILKKDNSLLRYQYRKSCSHCSCDGQRILTRDDGHDFEKVHATKGDRLSVTKHLPDHWLLLPRRAACKNLQTERGHSAIVSGGWRGVPIWNLLPGSLRLRKNAMCTGQGSETSLKQNVCLCDR